MYSEYEKASAKATQGCLVTFFVMFFLFIGATIGIHKILDDPSRNAIVMTKGNRKVMLLSSDSPQILAARQEARSTVNLFINALQKPKPEQDNFGICVALENRKRQSISEIWLRDIEYKEGKILGHLEEDGVYFRDKKQYIKGDIIALAPNKITDWRYDEQGKEVGNYTGKVIAEIRKGLGKVQ
jgi:uncharacterized protein YegJ (DUF2314 family)